MVAAWEKSMSNVHEYTDSLVRLVSQFMDVCSSDPAIPPSEYEAIRQRLLQAIS